MTARDGVEEGMEFGEDFIVERRHRGTHAKRNDRRGVNVEKRPPPRLTLEQQARSAFCASLILR